MRGHIEELPSGAFRVSIPLGKDPKSGQYLRSSQTVKGTKKDAERTLTKMLHDLDIGSYVEPAKQTVAEYLEQWLKDFVATKVDKPKTRRSYEMIVHRHLIPALGHVKLSRLTPAMVQGYYTRTLESGRLGTDGKPLGKPLSQTTVAHHHAVLHDALEFAVRLGLVGRNVADAVEPPKIRRKELVVWSEDEVRSFLTAARDSRYYPVFVLALTTGLRAGELFALRWQDVDLNASALTVNQTLEKPGPNPRFGRPKSKASRRTVTLSHAAVEALRSHKAKQNEERLQVGEAWHDFGLCFCVFDGKPLRPGNFRRDVFLPLIEKANVSLIRFHDLRHSHATMLLTAGIHPKVVSERLGHSGIGITLDTYSHVMPSLQRDAADTLDRRLFGTA